MIWLSASVSRLRILSRFFSRYSKNAASRITPYLITSAMPDRNSSLGRVLSTCEVHQDLFRLIEGADHVLAHGVVHAGLAADAAVDHGEERGGHLDEGNAAHERCCSKAGKIADHAAAEGDQRRFAVEAVREQRGIDGVRPVEVLVLFSVGHLDGHDQETRGLEAVDDLFPVQRS